MENSTEGQQETVQEVVERVKQADAMQKRKPWVMLEGVGAWDAPWHLWMGRLDEPVLCGQHLPTGYVPGRDEFVGSMVRRKFNFCPTCMEAVNDENAAR